MEGGASCFTKQEKACVGAHAIGSQHTSIPENLLKTL